MSEGNELIALALRLREQEEFSGTKVEQLIIAKLIRNLLDFLDLGIVILSSSGNVIYWNRFASDMVRFSALDTELDLSEWAAFSFDPGSENPIPIEELPASVTLLTGKACSREVRFLRGEVDYTMFVTSVPLTLKGKVSGAGLIIKKGCIDD